jgi:hypothetical protein
MTQHSEAVQTAYIYSTVKQFCQRHPAFTTGGIRHNIFHEHSNGLAKSGAIIRLGRKILINEDKFLGWVANQSGGVK